MKLIWLVLLCFIAYQAVLLYSVQNVDTMLEEYANTIKELEKIQESSKNASDLNHETLQKLEVMREKAIKSLQEAEVEMRVYKRLVAFAVEKGDTELMLQLVLDQLQNQK